MSYKALESSAEKPRYEVKIEEDGYHGYFERESDGSGGGLWFERVDGKMELIDYDGMTHLPKEVAETLRKAGFVVGEEFE